MSKSSITEDQEQIVRQALKEISWARRYKQGKIKNWQSNERMYYAMKIDSPDSRANVELGKMQEFVHTLLSKIRRPLVFKYMKRKESQIKRVKLLNAIREVDRKKGFWDIKELVGKKQLIVYGRKVYSYFADSIDGIYRSHLNNVDVYDFLIDPAGGGIDLEQARYMGDYGVVYTRQELQAGIKSKDFIKTFTQEILDGTGNATERPQEETNKRTRMYGQNTIGEKEIQDDDKFKFWRWCTTYKGVRYYVLLQERAGKAIRIEPLLDLISATDDYPLGAWPYWTAAAFPDLTEFWTPSYCDYVREVFMAQNVSINQMLDNAEAINKPMKKVNVNMIESMAELKYRKDGIIRVKGDFDVNAAVQIMETTPIETPLKVYDALEGIHEKASGVNANAKGASDPDGKVAIYEGNKVEMADRFGLVDMSYSFGYERFARLHEIGVRDNLTKKMAVDMVGPEGIEQQYVSKRDIFKKDDQFGVLVESSSDEMLETSAEKKVKFEFIQGVINSQNAARNANPNAPLLINPKKAFEVQAKMTGFRQEQIKEMLDVEDFDQDDVIAEAERDIESILNGEKIKPNAIANTAYMQRFVDFLQDHEEDMKEEKFQEFIAYMTSLGPTMAQNAAKSIQQHFIQTLNTLEPGTIMPPKLDVGSIAAGGSTANPAAPVATEVPPVNLPII